MSKVRFQMFLDERQKYVLEELQADFKVPIAEIIREAIDSFLAKYKSEKEEIPIRDKTIESLLSVAGICEGGPKNMADGHDKYLYGAPQK